MRARFLSHFVRTYGWDSILLAIGLVLAFFLVSVGVGWLVRY